MLNLIKFLIKGSIFAILVLIVANLVKWNGKTISDQVRTHIASAERSDIASKVKDWAGAVTNDARKGASRKSSNRSENRSDERSTRSVAVAREREEPREAAEELHDSERQKLRALIRELNTPERD